ncbi:MAG: TetR/AcrR family transcriptional regulator [Pseudomonadales bacterium]|nr:TetR/AcrR family transcriptional regulator [Pseudomonadales bacterium]
MPQSPHTSRKQQKAATRATIKEVTRRLLDSKDISDITIGGIAKEAGVANGTFYVHFQSKEEVLKELFSDINLEVFNRLKNITSSSKPQPLEKLIKKAAGNFLDFWHDNQGLAKMYAQTFQDTSELETLRDGMNPMAVQLMAQLLEQEAKSNKAKKRNWELVSHAISSIWLRVGLQYLFGNTVSRSEAIDTLTTLTLACINSVIDK